MTASRHYSGSQRVKCFLPLRDTHAYATGSLSIAPSAIRASSSASSAGRTTLCPELYFARHDAMHPKRSLVMVDLVIGWFPQVFQLLTSSATASSAASWLSIGSCHDSAAAAVIAPQSLAHDLRCLRLPMHHAGFFSSLFQARTIYFIADLAI